MSRPDDDDPPTPAGMRRGLTQYGDAGFSLFLRKAFIKGAGYTDDALERPVIGIADTGSGYNPCHGNMPALVSAVERGVMLAGGLPVRFPTISVHESFAHPTSMFLRNLMAMDTEEMLRAQPMDAVVLIGGCDKTVPAQLMGAASANVPAIQLVTGSMLTGSHRGQTVGACTDCRRFWGQHRAGAVDEAEIAEVNDQLVASVGTCSVMGTASTMACVAEALGVALPGSAAPPATTSARQRVAERSGAQAVALARQRLTIDRILSPAAFENALRVLLAIGGSTNGIVHLAAVAGRMGHRLDLDAFDRMARETPVLVNLKPAGAHYMEHFHAAGGMPVLLRELRPLLNLDALTVTGRTLGQELDDAPAPFAQDVIRPRTDPIYREGGLAVLRGNLAPGGAIIKPSAADPALMEHEGRAVVFENAQDLAERVDRDDLDVNPGDVLVLKGIGPKGAPGMPEAGAFPIPRKLLRQGVKDAVRISDGRMSGTAFGTVVLHVTPESADGGPLQWVQTGDRIRLSVSRRELLWQVSDDELARRRAAQPLQPPTADRGYRALWMRHVLQADEGVDFDFLRAVQPQGRVPRAPDARLQAVQAFYDFHPISAPQILGALAARGIARDALTQAELSAHDQDHYGGTNAVDRLMRHAAVRADDEVLDVCSGLGGPARWLAWKAGCRVTGLDLTESRVQGATDLTALAGLAARVRFVHGNALAMPFDDARFTLVVAQEAFAHVPTKPRLVREIARVLRPGGRVVFTDILHRGALGADDAARLYEGMRFSEIASAADYAGWLRDAGLQPVETVDLSEEWTRILVERHAMYRALREQTVARLGLEHFERYDLAYAHFVGLYRSGVLGGALIHARKPD